MVKLTYTQISRQITEAQDSINHFAKTIRNKQLIVFLGNTRSGKSTLVNYLIGNQLESFETYKRYYISLKSTFSGPFIDHGTVSCTLYPEVWTKSNDPTTLLVDMPGFDDNRGVIQRIINTLFTNQLRLAHSVKFVLVCDIADILSDNIQNFTTIITKMQLILPNFSDIKDSISVIFTKDTRSYSREDIVNILHRKIVVVIGLQTKKDLIIHICRHPQQIGIFRMPTSTGSLDMDQVDCNIEGAIVNSVPIVQNISSISFNIPEDAHSLLLETYQEFLNELDFSEQIKRVIHHFRRYFTVEKYVFASTEDELCSTKRNLQFISTRLTTEKLRPFSNLIMLIESLQSVAGTICSEFQNKLNYFKFMEEQLLLDETLKIFIIKSYVSALSKLESEVIKLIRKIEDEEENRSKETIQHVLSEVMSNQRKIKVLCAAFIPKVKTVLEVMGYDMSKFTFEVIEIGALGYGVIGTKLLGVAGGAYITHYYNTSYLRKKFRKEQGR